MELISNLFLPLFCLAWLPRLTFSDHASGTSQIRTTATTTGAIGPDHNSERGAVEAGMGQDCSFDGRSYKSGASWIHHEDCSSCSCHNGLSFCKPVVCDYPKGCGRIEKPPNSTSDCCPICADCVSKSGQSHSEGAAWDDDSCTSCSCVEGRKKCHTISCKTNCLRPKFVSGQCCPVCDEGAEGDVSSWSCPPTLDCPHPHEEHHCEHGTRLDSRGCPTCECNLCPSLASCSLECPSGFATDENGCATCKCIAHRPGHTCSKSSTNAPTNDEWFDGCRRCVCRNGQEMCSVLSCPAVPSTQCVDPIIYPGECCPRCSTSSSSSPIADENDLKFNGKASVLSCASSGRVHSSDAESRTETTAAVLAEFWSVGPCLNCTCHNGQVLCAFAFSSCPASASTPHTHNQMCRSQMNLDGECCETATCPENKQREITRVRQTRLNCFADDISSHVRTRVRTVTIYGHGESWKVGDCQTCRCENGQIDCFATYKCPGSAGAEPNCEKPVFLKGQCCQTCLDLDGYEVLIGARNYTSFIDRGSDNFDRKRSRIFLEPHCIILTVLVLILTAAVTIYFIKYRLRRKHRRQHVRHVKASIIARSPQHTPVQGSGGSDLLPLSPPTPPVTPNYDCCYKYYSGGRGQMSEQKTPLCSSAATETAESRKSGASSPSPPEVDGNMIVTSTFVEKV